jgi:hypothetical protein
MNIQAHNVSEMYDVDRFHFRLNYSTWKDFLKRSCSQIYDLHLVTPNPPPAGRFRKGQPPGASIIRPQRAVPWRTISPQQALLPGALSSYRLKYLHPSFRF